MGKIKTANTIHDGQGMEQWELTQVHQEMYNGTTTKKK